MTPPKDGDTGEWPPILRCKNHRAPSVFTPDALLREARRQKGISAGSVPEICILDPDGDIVRHLIATNRARRLASWACYHTNLHAFEREGVQYGVVGCAVGAAFAVLVAEELFASGCKLLIGITSAGQIAPVQAPPYFIILDRALRDEGTSYHYLPPAEYSVADERLVRLAEQSLATAGMTVQVGAAWTTDAPFRETAEAITAAQQAGILAVEMEAAALYAFAAARNQPVLCFAHVTNQMGRIEGDFEKGAASGAEVSLNVISHVVRAWRSRLSQEPWPTNTDISP
jgi:uridine phosphorylase